MSFGTLLENPSPQPRERPGAGASARPLLRTSVIPWLLLAPALALLLFTFAVPIVQVLSRSVLDPEPTLEHFVWFLSSPTMMSMMERTFVTAFLVTGTCLLLAIPYAFFMTIVSPRTRALMLTLVLIPFWTSTVVRNFSWVLLFQESGVINGILSALDLPSATLIRTTPGVIIAMSQVLIPFMVLPLYATMSRIDLRLIQAARSLGARPSIAFLRIYAPLARPGVTAGVVLVFVISLGFYITPAMIGSQQNTLISDQIWREINLHLNWGHGAVLAVALLAVTIVLFGLSILLQRRRSTPLQGGTK